MKVIISRKRTGKFCILITNKRRELTFMKAMEINREQFEQMVNGEKAVLIDFWALGAATAEDWGRHMKKLQKNIMAAAF